MKTKRMLSLVLCVCLVVSLFVGFAGTASAADSFSYTVKSGDTLYKICKNNGLDYYQCKDAIMVLNGFTSSTQLAKISIGQTIVLPSSNAVAATVKQTTTTTTTTTVGSTVVSTSTSTAATSGTATGEAVAMYLVKHTVKSGETLNSICNSYGSSYNLYGDMIKTMSGLTSTAIKAGQTVWIPVGTKPAGVTAYAVVSHKVNSGETIYGLCSTYGINYGTYYNVLKGLNGSVGYIKTGETLLIPTTTVASAAVVTTGTTATTTTTSTASSTTASSGYDINVVGYTANGTPYATVNGTKVTKAAAGSTVVIDGNGNNGYCLKTYEVYTLDGNSTVTVDKKTQNSFVMPSCGVKVVVWYIQGASITKEPFTNGTFSFAVNDVSTEYAVTGDKVTIKASPNSTYVAAGVTIKDSDGTVLATIDRNQNVTGSLNLKRTSINNYSFTMPDTWDSVHYCYKGIRVQVTFDIAATHVIAKTDKNRTYSSITYGTVKYLVNGSEASSIAEGATVTIQNTLPTGTNVYELTVTGATSGKKITITRVDGTANWTFVMPNEDVNVYINYGGSVGYSITTNVDSGHGTAQIFVDGTAGNTAHAGQKVKVIPTADTNYGLKEIIVRYSGLNTTLATQTDVDGTTYFMMPEANVTVFVRFAFASETKYHVAKTGAFDFQIMNTSGTRQDSFSGGETVCIVPIYDENTSYVDGVWYIDQNGKNVLATKDSYGRYTFAMPKYDCGVWVNIISRGENWVTIKFNSYDLSQGVTMVVTDSSGNKLSGDPSQTQQVLAGSTLTISLTLDSDKALNSMSVSGVNSLSGSFPTYTYTVSPKDTTVTFSATTKAAE